MNFVVVSDSQRYETRVGVNIFVSSRIEFRFDHMPVTFAGILLEIEKMGVLQWVGIVTH